MIFIGFIAGFIAGFILMAVLSMGRCNTCPLVDKNMQDSLDNYKKGNIDSTNSLS